MVVPHSTPSLFLIQVSTKLFDHLVTRSTTAYKQGIQNSLTRKLVLTDCRLVPGAGPPMMFILHCLHHCFHLEVIEATGFGGIGGAFHMNDLLVLLRTMNKMRPAPQVCCVSLPYDRQCSVVFDTHSSVTVNNWLC